MSVYLCLSMDAFHNWVQGVFALFLSLSPMPSSRPFLVQPWFQLLMPSTSPHLKSFFKGLGGPKRSGSLEKDQNHILGKQSRQSWGFPYPLQIPSENALRPKKNFPPHHKTLVHCSASATRQYDSQQSSLVHCSASATGWMIQYKIYNLLSTEVPYLTAK